MSKHKRDYFCRFCGCDLITHDEQEAMLCDEHQEDQVLRYDAPEWFERRPAAPINVKNKQ